MYNFKKGYYADVRIEDRFSTRLIYTNGKVEQVMEDTVVKAFIRVYDGNMWYYSSTTDINGIQGELDGLYSQATYNDKIDDNPIVKKYQVNKDCVYRFEDNNVRNVPIEKKHEVLQSTNSKITTKYLAMMQSVYIDRNSKYEFYSSKGAELKYDFQTTGVVYQIAVTDGKENFMNSLSKGVTDFNDVTYTDAEIDEFVKETENVLLNAKPCTQGVFPVVLAPEVTGVFAHESFGHKSEADFMLGDETMAREWQIGKAVGSELLSIVDTGIDLGSGYVPYDDEGTKCTKTYLIKDGILSGRLHSATTATALNEELTGNARAISCDYEPIVRMTSTYIDAGKSSFDDLIKGIKDGYYIKTCKHGSGMSTFTIAPNIAYRIVDGKLGEPVKISVMTGNVFETLGLIDGVGNDLSIKSFVGGGCGKMEQFPLNVGLGGPHIRVKSMNIQ